MRITRDLLVTLDACAKHRAAFVAMFPNGLDVTGEPDADVIARLVEARLDVGWLCDQVLTASALAVYDKAMEPVNAVYGDTSNPAYLKYRDAIAPAAATYRDARASDSDTMEAAHTAYEKAVAPAIAAYDKATAAARAVHLDAAATIAWRLLANPDNIRPEYRQ